MQVGVPDLSKSPYTFYAASSTGGIWKTTDNGITFDPVFDNEENLSIGDVEVSYSNPEILYVGTGNLSYWGNGMYKSTDAGKSWIHIGLENTYFISKIVIHPKNPDIVYVSAIGNIYIDSPEKGIFMTKNGGKTWERVLGLTDNGKHISGADVQMHPTDFNIIYASMWDPSGGKTSGIYKSVNAGKSWDKLKGGLPVKNLQRIGIDIYRSDPNIIVATILIEKNTLKKKVLENTIWRSRNGGKNWQRIAI